MSVFGCMAGGVECDMRAVLLGCCFTSVVGGQYQCVAECLAGDDEVGRECADALDLEARPDLAEPGDTQFYRFAA